VRFVVSNFPFKDDRLRACLPGGGEENRNAAGKVCGGGKGPMIRHMINRF
jgi:hypothetical protein